MVSDYHLLSLDVPGYGTSPISLEQLASRTVRDWSTYIVALLDEHEIETAYLVGENTGGAGVMYTAARWPHRVRACAICATPFRGQIIKQTVDTYNTASHRGGIEGWTDYMGTVCMNATDDPTIRAQLRAVELRCKLDVILHDGASWMPVDMSADVRGVHTPVMIVAPGRSGVVPREHFFEFERLLPNASLVLLGNASQFLAFTDAPTVSFITKAFFSKHLL